MMIAEKCQLFFPPPPFLSYDFGFSVVTGKGLHFNLLFDWPTLGLLRNGCVAVSWLQESFLHHTI